MYVLFIVPINVYRAKLCYAYTANHSGYIWKLMTPRSNFCMTHLHCVGVVGRVLKEAIVGVEDLPGQEEEELPGWTSIVQALFPVKGDVQLGLGQLLLGGAHHLLERILQEVLATDAESGNQGRIVIQGSES